MKNTTSFFNVLLFTSSVKRLLCFLLFTLFVGVTGCNKDEEKQEPAKEPAPFVLNTMQLRPLQVGILSLKEGTVSDMEYKGTLGGVKAAFFKTNDTTLAFIVPEKLPVGRAALRLDYEEKVFETEVTILENVAVVDPQATFDDFYRQLTTDAFFSGIDRTALDSAKAKFERLTKEEQKLAAQMLANNKVLLDQLAQALRNFYTGTITNPNSRKAECGNLCKVGIALTAVGAAITALSSTIIAPPLTLVVGATILTVLAMEPAWDILKPYLNVLLGKLGDALNMTYEITTNRMGYMEELVFDRANKELSLNRMAALPDTIFLKENEALKLSIKLTAAPLVSEANRKEYPVIGQLIDAVAKLRQMLVGIYEIPEFSQEEVKKYAESLEDFAVSVDNPKVKPSALSGTPELAQVSFQTAAEEDQPFNFTLTYTNEEGDTSSFSQLIKLKIPVNIDSTAFYETAVIGSWSVYGIESGVVGDEERKLVLYEDGYGRYVFEGTSGNSNADGIDENGNKYYEVFWEIKKIDNKYYLSEDGFWHYGFELYRNYNDTLPNTALTYPIVYFITYSFGDPSRKYIKN